MTTISQKQFLQGGTPTLIQPASDHLAEVAPPQDGGGIVDFAKGIAKGAIDTTVQTARAVQGLGQRAIAAATPLSLDQVRGNTGFKSLQGDQAAVIDQTLTANNSAQKAGKVTETIGEFLVPFLATEKAANVAGKTMNVVKSALTSTKEVAAKAPATVAKAILGEADTQIVKSGQNPMVRLFKTGQKRVSDVVGSIETGIKNFETTSKAQLQAVKNAIPDVQLAPQEIASRVNQGIMDSIQHSADYKGIKQGFETVGDIVNSGILKPEESQRIQKVVEFVGKWKDTSARGTLNLKEALSNFYATGENYTGSNAVVRSIQRSLVNLVGETAPEIRGALKTASGNIDKTEQFVEHLLGKDPVSGESKVLTLARNLSDKAKNGVKVDLVKELEKVSGSKIIPDLQGIFDYLQSSKLKAPGLQKPIETLKYGVKKAIESKIPLNKGQASVKTLVGGATGTAAAAAAMTGNTTNYKAVPEKIATETKKVASNIGNVLMQLESSGGNNRASADVGEKKWLTGLTEVAIKELKRLGIKKTVDVNNKADVLDASTKYFELMQKRHPNLTPGEVYTDYYWTQAKSQAQRDKKVNEVNQLMGII